MDAIANSRPSSQAAVAFYKGKFTFFWIIIALTAVVWILSNDLECLVRWPSNRVWPVAEWLNTTLNYLLRELTISGASVTQYSQSATKWLSIPVNWLIDSITVGRYYYLTDGAEFWLPPLPWFGTAILLVLLIYRTAGAGCALLSIATFAFVILLGHWTSTVTTLVAVLFSVLVSSALGLLLGVWASRRAMVSAILSPIYDGLQTIPVFSYLALIILIFGFGQIAALVATVIFAMPPMARATELALRNVSTELTELSEITGCTAYQRIALVDLPSRSAVLLLGINQVIMLSLAMVIITSVIGAGGLGADVIRSLRSMRMTDALSAGFAITLIAIVLDKTMQAWASRYRERVTSKRSIAVPFFIVLFGSVIVMVLFPDWGIMPDHAFIDAGRQLDRGLAWFNSVAGTTMSTIQGAFITYYLRPARELLSSLPWAPVALLVGSCAAVLGRNRLAIVIVLLLSTIALLGIWDKAMLSLYLVVLSIIVAAVIGVPIGICAGLNARVGRMATFASDLIQTLPTFVYLIPVVAIFGVGDFAAFVAISIFVIAPIIKYTSAGLQAVPDQLSEVAAMSGCTSVQRLRYVLMPAALPQLLLGLNQAVMLGFSMLVITALVGSRGLEETALVALAKVRPGDGLVAGFGIAALAIIVDRLLGAASRLVENRYAPKV